MNNKFGWVDPTHYRQLLLVLQLHAKGCSMFVELQVHHKDIKAHNDKAHSHDHFEYFRADLGALYLREMNRILELQMTLFAEICKVCDECGRRRW